MDAPGGAANAAANVGELGGVVRLLSVAGRDPEGERLGAAMDAARIDRDDLVIEEGRRTLAKERIVADGQLLIRFDQGSTDAVGPAITARLLDRLEALHAWAEAILVSDYGYGVIGAELLDRLGALQQAAPRPLVVDAKDLGRYRGLEPAAVKPNYSEAVALLGLPPETGPGARADQVTQHAAHLLDACGARIAAVTLDADGGVILERGAAPHRTHARPTSNDRAAGAGDTYAACLTLALAAGGDARAAAELSSAAAAVAVSREGTATCSAEELLTSLSGGSRHLDSLDEVTRFVELARSQGRRIVFTNGCFDILHRGHVNYLHRASALGDLLVVGVNSDAGVRRLKGAGRPINSLEERAQVLAALSCVDQVVAFDEDSPVELIRRLRPNVFAKGGDYTIETLPEAPLVRELGGEVQIIPLTEGRSTTRVIERIAASYGGEALSAAPPQAR